MKKLTIIKPSLVICFVFGALTILFSCGKGKDIQADSSTNQKMDINQSQKVALVNNINLSCGSDLNFSELQKHNLERYNRFMKIENDIISNKATYKSASTENLINSQQIIYVPVVVHVLHNGETIGAGNNISDEQVQSQISVLNEDFRRLNSDRFNTPAAFAGTAADTKIEFYLTCKDPNGNATNGINRVQTSVTSFTKVNNVDGSTNEQATRVKFSSQGGADAWPTDKYLNIWVCNLGGNLGGYAQFPADYSTKPNTDGIVVFNQCFGRGIGFNLLSGFDGGRIATHEVGHWLNLFHIWGDDGVSCAGSDQCGDTPNQAGFSRTNNSTCRSFPSFDGCTTGGDGIMYMNYMDYSYDACQNMFTNGQKDRIRAVFESGQPRNVFAVLGPPVSEGNLRILGDLEPDGYACPYYDYHVWLSTNNVSTVTWGISYGSIVYSYSDTHKIIRFSPLFIGHGGGNVWVTVTGNCSDEEYYTELWLNSTPACDDPEGLRKLNTNDNVAKLKK